jgi:hypothetical protein
MAIVYNHKIKGTKNIFYVGMGKDIKRAYSKSGRNKDWHDLVNKYGYDIEITHTDIIYEDSLLIERYLIDFYKSIGVNLVNKTSGGQGSLNRIISEETRNKISLALKGKKQTDEQKAKYKNRKHPRGMLNKKHKESTLQILREKRKGSLNSSSRKVIDVISGMIYYTLKDAARDFNINYTQLSEMLNGKRNNNTNLKFYEERRY